MTSPASRPSLSIMAACRAAGVSRRTIYNWMAAGKVAYCRTAGGSVRIFVDSLFRTADNQPLPAGVTDDDGLRHPRDHA